MTYSPSGNPATGAEGLSALMRAEFASIGTAFALLPPFTATGLFSTTFVQQGNFTFTLPPVAGTLATTANVATEAGRAIAAEGVLTTAVSAEATARIAAITTETTRATAAEAALASFTTVHNVVGSRSIGTIFTNTSGRPIFVAATILPGNQSQLLSVFINGTAVYTAVGGSPTIINSSTAYPTLLICIIPAGQTYKIDTSPYNVYPGTPSILTWCEIY